MTWDLWQVKHSDIIICDFSHPGSIGTTWELAVAKENDIPIIGVYTNGEVKVHPWWEMTAIRICYDIDDLIDYVSLFYRE